MKRTFFNIKEIVKFGFVGVMNTIIGTAVMFFAYNVLHCGYWLSSALNYVIGSVFSYFANKYFTFKSQKRSAKEVFRFALNIIVCYLLAYGIAEPLITRMGIWLKVGWEENILEQIAMLVGMCLFVGFNFIGQKIFVFGRKKSKNT